MISISYAAMVLWISALWLLVRVFCWIAQRRIHWRRELQLMLVYICIVVVVRFTFCPFGKVDGKIQPLVFDPALAFPPRINLEPFVHMADYPTRCNILMNFFGNAAMFLPLGIIWPIVFKKLSSHWKVMAAGVGCSLCIELLQLPFYDRVSDIDDLIMNSFGFLIGYIILLLVRMLSRTGK